MYINKVFHATNSSLQLCLKQLRSADLLLETYSVRLLLEYPVESLGMKALNDYGAKEMGL